MRAWHHSLPALSPKGEEIVKVELTAGEVRDLIDALEEWTQEGIPGSEELQNKLKEELQNKLKKELQEDKHESETAD